MENEVVVHETEMELETAIRKDIVAVMSAMSRRHLTKEELATVRAKVAEAAAALKKPLESAS